MTLLDSLRDLVMKAGDGQTHCVVASNLEQTDLLWKQLADEASEQIVPWSNVVLLFDGEGEITDHPFRPEHWFTPWDWALATSINLIKSPLAYHSADSVA